MSVKSQVLACVNIKQLVTLAGPPRPRTGAELRELSIIENATLLCRDGRIEAVGRASELAIPPDAEIVDAGGRIVLPGFVDAHTHPVFAGTRADEYEQRAEGATYAEIAARGGGIRSTVRRTRAAEPADLLASAERYAEWFLRGGTTTIEAKSGYGLSLEAELKILRVIRRLAARGRLRYVPTFLGAHEIPDEFRGRTSDYVRLVTQEMLPRVAAEGLAEYCDVFCEPNVFRPKRHAPCCAPRAIWLRPAPARRSIHRRRRRVSRRGTWGGYGGSPGGHYDCWIEGAACGQCPAGTVTGLRV